MLVVLLSCVVLMAGCHTVAGAASGAKDDYKEAKKVDAWLQENAW
jgi:predicted small secreted protein